MVHSFQEMGAEGFRTGRPETMAVPGPTIHYFNFNPFASFPTSLVPLLTLDSDALFKFILVAGFRMLLTFFRENAEHACLTGTDAFRSLERANLPNLGLDLTVKETTRDLMV